MILSAEKSVSYLGVFGAFRAFSSRQRFCPISITSFSLYFWCFSCFFVVYVIVSCIYVVRCSSSVFLVLIVLYCCVWHSVTNCSRMSKPRAFGAFRAFCVFSSRQRCFLVIEIWLKSTEMHEDSILLCILMLGRLLYIGTKKLQKQQEPCHLLFR